VSFLAYDVTIQYDRGEESGALTPDAIHSA